MATKIPTVLYLDCDYALTLSPRLAGGIRVVLIPEVVYDIDKVSDTVDVRRDRALNSSRNRMSVYHPTNELLMKIRRLTESGEIDIVVIGNNNGAGIIKAPFVAQRLREQTIIIANFWPNSRDYEPLGYRRFVPRELLAAQLLELLKLID